LSAEVEDLGVEIYPVGVVSHFIGTAKFHSSFLVTKEDSKRPVKYLTKKKKKGQMGMINLM
jgi:hypothetical protein